MMKIRIISFTSRGKALARRISSVLKEEGFEAEAAVKNSRDPESLKESLSAWTERQFSEAQGIIFVGAAGIAVRAVAPFVKSKAEDPAVLAVDEAGRYCIPLLSGHLGGANALACLLGKRLGMEPVLTTATDINGKWAVDVFAAKNGLFIQDLEGAKKISARILGEEPVTLKLQEGNGQVEGELPPEVSLFPGDGKGAGPHIFLGIRKPSGEETILCLIPRRVILGIGCRKGVSEEEIALAVETALEEAGIWPQSVRAAATIRQKEKEPGLVAYCRSRGISLQAYDGEELKSLQGAFTASSFVEQVTGVDNVCERSALLCAGKGGKLILAKRALGPVTVAAAEEKWRVDFG